LEEAGLVMGTFGIGAILGSFIGGKLTDKFGFHYVQVFSLLLNGILFFVLGAMHTLWHIALCVFVLSSLGEAFRPANATAIAAYSTDSNRTRCYSLNRLAVNLGWAIGPAIGGILASIDYSWLFWADGSTCIAAAIFLYVALAPDKTKAYELHPADIVQKTNSAYSDKVFLKTMAFIFLVSLCFFQLFSIVPVFYRDDLHLGKATIGFVLALNGIIIVLVEMILVYKLENKRSPMHYMVTGALLMGLSFLLLNLPGIFLTVLLSIIVITFGEMFLFPFVNNFWVSRSTHPNRGQYAAAYNITFALAQVLAPTLAAQVAVLLGFHALWIINFLLCSIAAGGFFYLRKQLV
jgi:predicted MFS family arabinose efflux permease